jgi:hypothetical protein
MPLFPQQAMPDGSHDWFSHIFQLVTVPLRLGRNIDCRNIYEGVVDGNAHGFDWKVASGRIVIFLLRIFLPIFVAFITICSVF